MSEPRISKTVRKAVDLIAFNGLTQREAANRLKIHEQYLSRVLRQPHAKAYLAEEKSKAAQDLERLKARAKRMAIETAIELMGPDQPAAVRAKMVELLSREVPAAASGPVVQVNVDRGGYEYVRPGQSVVEIVAQDTQSAPQPMQAIENKGSTGTDADPKSKVDGAD